MIGHIPVRCMSATIFASVCDQDSVMEFVLYLYDRDATWSGLRERAEE